MRHRDFFQRIGLGVMLLVAGVLGWLMVPLPSEAGTPTLTIDGVTFTEANGGLVRSGPGCGSDNFTNGTVSGCYSVTGTNVYSEATRTGGLRAGNVLLWDVSATNQARVLVNDQGPGTQNMKLTGTVLASATNIQPSPQPTAPASPTTSPCPIVGGIANTGCHRFFVTLTNTFNAVTSSQTAGSFSWVLSANGQFDPVGSTTNAINNKFRLSATACFNAVPCVPPPVNRTCDALTCSPQPNILGTINTGVIATGPNGVPKYIPTTPVSQTSSPWVNTDNNTATTSDICNTTNGRCQPTALYEYEVWVQGLDALFLVDSIAGCGGPCRLDRATNRLLQCGDENTPGTLVYQCAQETSQGIARDLAEFGRLGGEAADTCEGTCLIIFGDGTPASDATGEIFHFTSTGQGVDVSGGWDMILNSQGTGWKVFSNLTPDLDPVNDERFFTIPIPIPGYPFKNNGKPWSTDQISCSSAEGVTGSTVQVISAGNNSSDKIALRVLTLVPNDILFCKWHFH